MFFIELNMTLKKSEQKKKIIEFLEHRNSIKNTFKSLELLSNKRFNVVDINKAPT